MEVGGGSRVIRDPKEDEVIVESGSSSSSEMSLSTASNSTLKDPKTIDGERKKERKKEKKEEKQKKRRKSLKQK